MQTVANNNDLPPLNFDDVLLKSKPNHHNFTKLPSFLNLGPNRTNQMMERSIVSACCKTMTLTNSTIELINLVTMATYFNLNS